MWERLQKFLDRLESRWALVALIGGGGAVSGVLARATDWLNVWGPIAWWGAFLMGALVVAALYFIGVTGYARWLRAKEINRVIERTGVNPLDDRFERQTIFIPDLYNRDYVPHDGKHFRDCYLHGPAMIYLDGCNLNSIEMAHCQVVLAGRGQSVFGVTIFRNCHFVGGVFSNLTVVVTPADYGHWPQKLKQEIPVIRERVQPFVPQ